ncbi:MAG: mechanosensitive ion channel [Thermodesulfobacteriota bacterium]
MDIIHQFIDPLLVALSNHLPSAFGALLLFLLGIAIASLLRKSLARLLASLEIDQRIAARIGETVSIEQFVANLCYYMVLLSVLLVTLNVLGVQGVLDPVRNMFTNLLGAIPNIVAAILIGFVGYVVARIVSSATEMVTRGLDSVSLRLGLSQEFRVSRLLGQIIFVLVFIPVLISALDALRIEAISVPSTRMLEGLLTAIPKVLAAALILTIAYVVGRFVTTFIVELLQSVGADSLPAKMGITGLVGDNTSFSRLCGGIAFFFIMLAASVSAAEQLAMGQLSVLLGDFLGFSGQIVLGLIVLAVGNFIATLSYNALMKTADNKSLAGIARAAIIALVLAMGLRAMGIADDIVNLAFGLTLGAIAVTVALAFGLGGREAAGRQMEYWLSKLRKPE